MKPLRILWTMPYLPWPVTSGGKARQYHLLRTMAERGHHITLLVQSKTPADEATLEALRPWLKALHVLPRRSLKHPLTLWHAATSPLPLLASVNSHAPALTRRFDELLDSARWDIVQVEHSYALPPLLGVLERRRQPFMLVEHNVESGLGDATYGKWPAPLRPLGRYDAWRARRWERQALGSADVVVAVTESDARALGRIGERPTFVVSNGADVRGFASVTPDLASGRVLFVGNYEYAPNVDAVEWALDELWPRLWALAPQARFVVCGHAMPARWARRWTDPRIEWRGYVDDLRAEQSRCAVFLAPLRSGGGSKLKVLEALAAGLPLVSTTEGVTGLGLQAGVHAHVADDPAVLAAHVTRLLADAVAAADMARQGRDHVVSHFDWTAAAAQLEAVHRRLQALSREPSCA